jgi:hypothetical protein
LIVSFNNKTGTKKVFVTVDESGDLGTDSKYFVYGATTLSDAKRFADVASHYHQVQIDETGHDREMGFNKSPYYREQILRESAPYVDNVYVVVIRKKRGLKKRYRRKLMAEYALERLTDMVLIDNDEYHVQFIVDESSYMKNNRVVDIVESNDFAEERDVICLPTRSIDSYELQTHDYYVGAIAHEYEADDSKYRDMITAPIKERRFVERLLRRRKNGKVR